ncbi:MAG: right-handed parallel beta-helix repeat-containing protein [Candidatus Firestonebacteria bacterium]|nr:right-handed parallel beta-helix repeat-containing protein [Candidatus Firestonebacteria bacterium]
MFKKILFFILILIIFLTLKSYAATELNITTNDVSYLAYSEFANEYIFGGEILTHGTFWLNQDNSISIYESSKLYQYDINLNFKSSLELKDMQMPYIEKDTTRINPLEDIKLKIILIPESNQSYYLIKKKYTTQKEDIDDITEKLKQFDTEEKEYNLSLQSITKFEQSERNKIALTKSSLSTSEYNSQIYEIKQKYVEKRNEIEKKMIELFRSRNKLEYKKTILANKEYSVEIERWDTTQNVEIKKFVFPDNFWGVNLFDLKSIISDNQGVFYGFRKEDNRVYVFDYSGELLSSFMVDGIPKKILVDKNKNIYVINTDKIRQFKPIGFTRSFLQPTVNNLNVIGSIMEETTWSGTVIIVGETRIEKKAILNIQPGTQIIFRKGTLSHLNVFGTIRAIGKKDSYIVFKADTPYTSGDVNIYADESEEVSIISFCRFENMQYAIRIYDSSPEISHNIIIKNEDGIWYQGTNPLFITKCTIIKNTIKNNVVGILITFLTHGNNPSIQYNNIYDNKKTNLTYKNTENLEIPDNYWGIAETQKILETITVESKEEDKMKILIDPVLPILFDIIDEN